MLDELAAVTKPDGAERGQFFTAPFASEQIGARQLNNRGGFLFLTARAAAWGRLNRGRNYSVPAGVT
jgi:hypothetical protein